ncbi:hypothetical protein JOE68_005700 [Saccharothrix algeriensis]|uniref:Uncharacterized protein n=1 Tax=Saccharothrix algeriensis TaxID=173560 RepID=A0ABS2SEY2_9PSEU|nr:hypothetical protein [Saccharothrix algeriensis]
MRSGAVKLLKKVLRRRRFAKPGYYAYPAV